MAAVFVRGCGATTPFATHVNLRYDSRPFTVTQYGTIEDGEVYMRKGEGPVKLVWQDATHLVVECRLTDVCEQKASWNSIAIVYRPSRK